MRERERKRMKERKKNDVSKDVENRRDVLVSMFDTLKRS